MSPEFWERLRVYILEHPQQRFGQAFFNCLHETHPDVANEIRGRQGLDPFYNDNLVGAAIAYATVKGC